MNVRLSKCQTRHCCETWTRLNHEFCYNEQDDKMRCLKSWMLKFAEIQQFLEQFCLYVLKNCINLNNVISLHDKIYCQFSNKKNDLKKSKFSDILIFQFSYFENYFHYLILLVQSIIFFQFFLTCSFHASFTVWSDVFFKSCLL